MFGVAARLGFLSLLSFGRSSVSTVPLRPRDCSTFEASLDELKHFGWHVAFLHAGCRVKWLLASMLACSPCVAGRHVELYDGQAAPITIYGISYDNYYGAYLIMALIFIAGVLAGIAGLKIWQHFFVVEVVKIVTVVKKKIRATDEKGSQSQVTYTRKHSTPRFMPLPGHAHG